MNIVKNTLFLLVLFICLHTSLAYPTYEEYLHDFNKTYSSKNELTKRKQIYQSRIAMFSNITDYTPGVNDFTDWTDEEIKRLKSYKHQKTDQIMQETESTDESPYLRVSAPDIPQSIDWRERKAVTSVKNQGSCGSCWAFGVAAYIQSKLIIQKAYPTSVDLSEQYLLSCTPGSDCTGGYITDTLQTVARGGIPYQSSFQYNPYGSISSKICSTKDKITEAGSKYRRIDRITDAQLVEVLQYGPVVATISSQRWQMYGGGVFSCPSNSVTDHVALVVGYTNTTWILKNQWGKTWGQSGYMRITRSRNVTGANCVIGQNVVYLDPVTVSLESSGLIVKSCLAFFLIIFTVLMI